MVLWITIFVTSSLITLFASTLLIIAGTSDRIAELKGQRLSKSYRWQHPATMNPPFRRLRVWELCLEQLHLPIKIHLSHFILFRLMLLFSTLTVAILLAPQRPVYCLSTIIAAYYTPLLTVNYLIKRRREAVMEELPHFIDLLRIYLVAGFTPYQAIKIAGDLLADPLKREVRQLEKEIELRHSFSEALDRFSKRIGTQDAENLAGALKREFYSGVNDLGKVLFKQAQQIRQSRIERIKQRIKSRPVVMAVIPALLVINILIILTLPVLLQILDVYSVGPGQ